jgi:SAM-dependent methyltransferase
VVLKTDLFEEAFGRDALVPSLARNAARVVAFDVSPRIARAGAVRCGGGERRFAAADVRRLPFRDGSFDLVLSPSTLDHFRDPSDLGRSLVELARVLKPEGRIIVTLDNRQNVTDWLLRLAHRLGLVPYYLGRSYRIGELCRELETAGFEVRGRTAILHAPRLSTILLAALVRRTGWRLLERALRRCLLAAARLEGTRWRYYSGSFVAAVGVRRRERP